MLVFQGNGAGAAASGPLDSEQKCRRECPQPYVTHLKSRCAARAVTRSKCT